jgi:hypothetical protein
MPGTNCPFWSSTERKVIRYFFKQNKARYHTKGFRTIVTENKTGQKVFFFDYTFHLIIRWYHINLDTRCQKEENQTGHVVQGYYVDKLTYLKSNPSRKNKNFIVIWVHIKES